jgi:hypothetical protein
LRIIALRTRPLRGQLVQTDLSAETTGHRPASGRSERDHIVGRARKFRERRVDLAFDGIAARHHIARGTVRQVLLGQEHFGTYLAELVEALETGSDPGAFWAKWIDVVVERTPPETDEPKKEEASTGAAFDRAPITDGDGRR